MRNRPFALVLLLVLALALASASAARADSPEERDFRTASNAFESRLFSHAHRWFLIFVQKYPQSPRLPEAYLKMGVCSYNLEEYERARGELKAVLDRFPYSEAVLDARYWLGEVELAEGNYAKAVEHFRRVLNSPVKTEYDERATLSLAYALFRLGNPSAAAAELDRLARSRKRISDPDRFDFIYGMALFDLGRYEQALARFRAVLNRSGKGPYAARSLFWLAECLYKLDRFDEALRAYYEMRRRTDDPEMLTRVLYGLGWAYFKTGDFSDSLAAFRELLRFRPASPLVPVATFKIAENLYRLGDYRAAIRRFRRLLSHPDYGDSAAFYIGECLYRMKRYRAALSRLMAVPPDCGRPLKVLVLRDIGLCLYELNRFGESYAAFRAMYAAARTDADRAAALSFQGDVRYAEGRFKEALELFRKALTDYPGAVDVPRVRYYIGMCLFKQGLYEEAKLVFTDTWSRFPDEEWGIRSLFQSAELLRLSGDFKGAVELYERLVSLDGVPPELADRARFDVAVCRFNMASGDRAMVEEALRDFRSLAEKCKTPAVRVEALYQSALCLLQLDRFDEARAVLERIATDFPDSAAAPAALLEIAMALLDRGRTREALDGFKRLVSAFPDSPQAADALFRSASIRLSAGDAEGARAALETLLKRFPKAALAPRAEVMLAAVMVAERRFDEALAEYERLGKKYASSPLADLVRVQKGELLLLLERPAEALKSFEGAFSSPVDEWAARARWGAAQALRRLGRSEDALEHLLKLVFAFPSDPHREDALFLAASIETDLGRYDEALKLLDLAADRKRAERRAERIRKLMRRGTEK